MSRNKRATLPKTQLDKNVTTRIVNIQPNITLWCQKERETQSQSSR